MVERLAPLTGFVLVLLLVWLGWRAALNAGIETRVARQFDQLLKAEAARQRHDATKAGNGQQEGRPVGGGGTDRILR